MKKLLRSLLLIPIWLFLMLLSVVVFGGFNVAGGE